MSEKAIILVEHKSGEEQIEVMYNPNEYTVSMESELEGEGANITFGKTNLQDLTINLFFDTYETKEDVRTKIKPIANLLFPSEEGKGIKQPPFCRFVWGKNVFRGVVKKIDQKFIMFLGSGIPIRAEVTVVFKSILTAKEHTEMTGQSQSRKYWTVQSGDRLDLIANKILGNPSLWRVVAKANGITDPINFPGTEKIGTVLIIPDYYNMKQE